MKRWASVVVVASLLALGACDSGGGDDSRNSSDAQPGSAALGGQSTAAKKKVDPHYAVFPDKVPGAGWELTEAVRETTSGRSESLGGLPGVDWYAEFDGPQVDGDARAYLSLTGYTQSLDERRTESTTDTSDVHEGEINGRPAFWSTEPDDPDAGVTITMKVTDDYSLEVFATGVSLDDLLAIARTVRDATEAEWIAAGGRLSECADGADDCPEGADG